MGKRRAKRHATGRGHLEEQNQVFDRGREYLMFRFRAFGQTVKKWQMKRQFACQRSDFFTFEVLERAFYTDVIEELVKTRSNRGRCIMDMQSQLKLYLGEQEYVRLRPILRGECLCYRCSYSATSFEMGRDLLLKQLKSFKETCNIWRAKLSIDSGEVLKCTESFDDFRMKHWRLIDDAFARDAITEMINARKEGACVCDRQSDLKDYCGVDNFMQLDPVFADDCGCCIDSSNLLEAEEEQHCLGIDEEEGIIHGEMSLVDDDCSSEHDDGGSSRGGLTSRMCALPVVGSSGDWWWKAIKDPSARGMDRAGIG